ncbi:MAG: hypothetical protein SPI25_05235 [Dialister sp.]|nr:hypothetical protein [Dialister sp.]
MDTDSGHYTRIGTITRTLKKYLAKSIPFLDWSFEITGAAIPSKPSGTVTADVVTFDNPYKYGDAVTIEYTIYLIAPLPSSARLDEWAMTVRSVLADNPDLGGAVTDSNVSKIIFGAAPGIHGASGACMIRYEIEADF